jgi:hypothetical protein
MGGARNLDLCLVAGEVVTHRRIVGHRGSFRLITSVDQRDDEERGTVAYQHSTLASEIAPKLRIVLTLPQSDALACVD